MSNNKKEQFWDKVAKKEAKEFDRFTESYQKTLNIMEQYLSADQQVLDFACGNGKIALPIADKVAHITGLDISSGMIELLKKQANKQGKTNFSFVHGTLDNVELKPESFDLIVACNILHLLDDPQTAVTQIHRLLKPGGLFISSTGVIGEGKRLLKGIIWLMTKINVVPPIQYFTNEQVEGIVAKHFDIIERAELEGTFKDLNLVARKS